jgi:hypothetical protein
MLLFSCQDVITIILKLREGGDKPRPYGLREAIHGMVGGDLSHIQVSVAVFCLVGEGKGNVLCQYFV